MFVLFDTIAGHYVTPKGAKFIRSCNVQDAERFETSELAETRLNELVGVRNWYKIVRLVEESKTKSHPIDEKVPHIVELLEQTAKLVREKSELVQKYNFDSSSIPNYSQELDRIDLRLSVYWNELFGGEVEEKLLYICQF